MGRLGAVKLHAQVFGKPRRFAALLPVDGFVVMGFVQDKMGKGGRQGSLKRDFAAAQSAVLQRFNGLAQAVVQGFDGIVLAAHGFALAHIAFHILPDAGDVFIEAADAVFYQQHAAGGGGLTGARKQIGNGINAAHWGFAVFDVFVLVEKF